MQPALVLTSVMTLLSAAAAQAAEHPANWSRPTTPFEVVGNVYYVGSEGLSSFLVVGPSGHVLIDGGLPSSADMIARNISKLGFDPKDVRYLLINHSHFDHAGGLAELKRITGARLAASEGDRRDLEAGQTRGRTDLEPFPPVHVDRIVRDGDQIRLGPIVLTALLTPGHTRGSTSWTTMAGGRRVIFASSITVAGQPLVADADYPGAASDFRRTFAKLRATKADVFLNFHAEGFGLATKRSRQAAGDPDAFVDPGELPRQVQVASAAFESEFAKQVSERPARRGRRTDAR